MSCELSAELDQLRYDFELYKAQTSGGNYLPPEVAELLLPMNIRNLNKRDVQP